MNAPRPKLSADRCKDGTGFQGDVVTAARDSSRVLVGICEISRDTSERHDTEAQVDLDGFLKVVRSRDDFWLKAVRLPREACS